MSISLNIGYLKTAPGLLKLFQTIIGAVCLHYVTRYGFVTKYFVANREQTLFFIATFAFLVTTFLLLLSAIVSSNAATVLPKTVFESLYHLVAFVFYLSVSVAFLISVNEMHKENQNDSTRGRIAAAAMGLVNSVLYFWSAFFSIRTFRSG